MQKLKILNTREIKEIKELLEKQFGFSGKLGYAFLQGENGKLFIVNKEIEKVPPQKLRVDKYGLYFGELRNKELRLSMEGAWLVGKEAGRGLVEINKEELKTYFRGESLQKDLGKERKFMLLKFRDDVIGCAKYKDGEVINFLPKIHRSGEVIV